MKTTIAPHGAARVRHFRNSAAVPLQGRKIPLQGHKNSAVIAVAELFRKLLIKQIISLGKRRYFAAKTVFSPAISGKARSDR
jgi:hypothetical protein